MLVDLFQRGRHAHVAHENIVRVEVALVHHTEEQYKVIVLDADDTFDVIIHYPNGEREAVWSLVKEPEL